MGILKTQKRNRFFSISFLNVLAIVGMLTFVLPGCSKDDVPEIQYNLTIKAPAADAGTIEVSPKAENGMYKEGTKVLLTVKTNAGHSFRQWSGDASGTETTVELVMDGDKTVEALFDKLFSLNTSALPAEAGSIEVTPKSDGGLYKEGTKVTLTAKPADGFLFKEWGGDAVGATNTVEITMNANKSINASFIAGVSENFDDNVANNFIDDKSGLWSVADNAYSFKGNGENKWRYSIYNKTFDDFEYSVDIKATGNTNADNAAGIFFRSLEADPTQNSYRLAISQVGQWYLAKFKSGALSWINPWSPSASLNQGFDKTNNLKVVCSGQSIEVFINGVSHGVFTDSDFTSGYAGVLGYDQPNYTNTFIFDNFIIKKVAPQKSKAARTASRPQSTAGMDPRFSR